MGEQFSKDPEHQFIEDPELAAGMADKEKPLRDVIYTEQKRRHDRLTSREKYIRKHSPPEYFERQLQDLEVEKARSKGVLDRINSGLLKMAERAAEEYEVRQTGKGNSLSEQQALQEGSRVRERARQYRDEMDDFFGFMTGRITQRDRTQFEGSAVRESREKNLKADDYWNALEYVEKLQTVRPYHFIKWLKAKYKLALLEAEDDLRRDYNNKRDKLIG
jgi:hypothetical protein